VSGEREIPETGLARAGQEVRPSVVLTTYEQPRALELVLWGYARQTHTDFEIVVADDGSGPRTGEVIDRLSEETSLDIRRVWHEDRGFRKTEILNRAIVAATGQYLIFSDGDCIPREDFVAVHMSEARAGTFPSGGYLKIPRGLSERLTVDDVRSGSVFKRSWLTSGGWKGGRRRLIWSRRVGRILDRVTPTRATWNGHNASAWKSCILAVNGFDMDMGYGGLDRALGERLANIGVSGRQIRHRAPCLHVWHPRPYRTPEVTAANRAIRDRIRANREEWARVGISEFGDSDASV